MTKKLKKGNLYLNVKESTGIPINALVRVETARWKTDYDVVVVNDLYDEDNFNYRGMEYWAEDDFLANGVFIPIPYPYTKEDIFMIALEHGIDVTVLLENLK